MGDRTKFKKAPNKKNRTRIQQAEAMVSWFLMAYGLVIVRIERFSDRGEANERDGERLGGER